MQMKKILLVSLVWLASIAGNSQVNLDFEAGNFSGWTGSVGNTSTGGAVLTVSPGIITTGMDANLYVPSYHTIMSAAGGNDFFGNFPVISPGGNYSARLGNCGTSVNGVGTGTCTN